MDAIILGTALSGLLLFIFTQFCLFRFINTDSVIKWLLILFYCIAVFLLLIEYYSLLNAIETTNFDVLLVLLLTLLIYSLLVACYVIGIFGVVTASLRIRLLERISGSPHGISEKELLMEYNKNVIIRKRLTRFIASGNLVYIQGKYSIDKKLSPLILLTVAVNKINQLFLKGEKK